MHSSNQTFLGFYKSVFHQTSTIFQIHYRTHGANATRCDATGQREYRKQSFDTPKTRRIQFPVLWAIRKISILNISWVLSVLRLNVFKFGGEF